VRQEEREGEESGKGNGEEEEEPIDLSGTYKQVYT